MEVSGGLRIQLLVLLDVDAQRLRLGKQLIRGQGLLLLLQLLQLYLLYLRALLLLLTHRVWVLVVGCLPVVSKLRDAALILFHNLVHRLRLLVVRIAIPTTTRREGDGASTATFDLALTFVDDGANG